MGGRGRSSGGGGGQSAQSNRNAATNQANQNAVQITAGISAALQQGNSSELQQRIDAAPTGHVLNQTNAQTYSDGTFIQQTVTFTKQSDGNWTMKQRQETTAPGSQDSDVSEYDYGVVNPQTVATTLVINNTREGLTIFT